MKTTIKEIFREILPQGSFAMSRRYIIGENVRFNSQPVTSIDQEVEVGIGSTFQLGKRQSWFRDHKEWVRVSASSLLQSNPKWDDNSLQFPRLLAEIMATQDNLDITALAEAMDVEEEDVVELMHRAQKVWEKRKEQFS